MTKKFKNWIENKNKIPEQMTKTMIHEHSLYFSIKKT